ncbi:MAG: hypothetical protein ACREM3_06050 [Candidatus Rokuibacteriota bacterium]
MIVECVRALPRGEGGESLAALPRRVRDVIGARLGRLSPTGRRLVTVAATIGREFEFPLLQVAAGLDAAEAARGVEELVRRRVLDATRERFRFVHDRVRQAAYDAVPLFDRPHSTAPSRPRWSACTRPRGGTSPTSSRSTTWPPTACRRPSAR